MTAPQILPLSEKYGSVVVGAGDRDIFALSRDRVIELFQASSLVLFRGFALDTERFKAFTNQFGAGFMTYAGGSYNQRQPIGGDKTVLSVTGANLKYAIPLHGEMYYLKHKPSLLWFYCAVPPLQGGETTVCDGIQLYAELGDAAKEFFSTQRIKYIRSYADGVWQEVYQTEDPKAVEKICTENGLRLEIDAQSRRVRTEYLCSALIPSRCGRHSVWINNILPVIAQESILGQQNSLVRCEDGSKIPEAVLSELKTLAERLTQAVAWQPGDLLMVDNTRLLHGRRAYADDQRQVYVRLSQMALPV